MILMVIYKDNVYLRLGILAGMALTHGGGSMNVFSLSVFECICGVAPADLKPDICEVADHDIRDVLEKVCHSSTCVL